MRQTHLGFQLLTSEEAHAVGGGLDLKPGKYYWDADHDGVYDEGEKIFAVQEISKTGGEGTDYYGYTRPDGSAIILFEDNGGHYSSDGQTYYSSTGLAFDDFQSCVDHYANEFMDASGDPFGSFGPIGFLLDELIGSQTPTDIAIDSAMSICS